MAKPRLGKRPKGKPSSAGMVERVDVDLTAYEFFGDPGHIPGKRVIRVSLLEKYEDLRSLTGVVYEGGALILDFSPIANEQISITRMVNHLKKVVSDVGGSWIRFGENCILVTSSGLIIDGRG